MTVLALKLSRAANGVSELHGQVSRHMWQSLYPGKTVDEVPIGHITNGIHLLGWMKGTGAAFLAAANSTVDAQWRSNASGTIRRRLDSDINSPEFWEKMTDPNFISDEELWALRYKLRRELIEFARRRLLMQGQRVRARAISSRSTNC